MELPISLPTPLRASELVVEPVLLPPLRSAAEPFGKPASEPLAQSAAELLADEVQLVARARHDREAFAQLYRLHQGAIATYILRRVGDGHATEDLVAEVFLSVMRHLPRYRSRGLPLRAWLYRIAANAVNRWVRRERRWLREGYQNYVDSRRTSQSNETSRSDVRNGVENEIENDGEFARLALLSLSPKYQTVLSLHYLEGLSLEQIAAAVGCRVGTVKSRLSRGRDALREKLLKGRT